MLVDWFSKRILKDAAKKLPVVSTHINTGKKFNMRTVRSRFATAWAAAKKEAEAAGKEVPANPL